jgi:hypothetical protein
MLLMFDAKLHLYRRMSDSRRGEPQCSPGQRDNDNHTRTKCFSSDTLSIKFTKANLENVHSRDSITALRIRRVAQRVACEVERQHRQHDHEARRQQPRVLRERTEAFLAYGAQENAPARHRFFNA